MWQKEGGSDATAVSLLNLALQHHSQLQCTLNRKFEVLG